ncbi:DUF4244 domain-containing protein [Brachybacterium huguangmaarense]
MSTATPTAIPTAIPTASPTALHRAEKPATAGTAARADGACTVRECLADDTGATTAEYAITTLAACGFAAVLVVLLKSGEVRSLLMGIITSALSMGS